MTILPLCDEANSTVTLNVVESTSTSAGSMMCRVPDAESQTVTRRSAVFSPCVAPVTVTLVWPVNVVAYLGGPEPFTAQYPDCEAVKLTTTLNVEPSTVYDAGSIRFAGL